MFNHVPFTSRATTTMCADFSSFFLGQRSNSLSPIPSPLLATSNVVNLFETMDDVSRSDDVASRACCSANLHAVARCHCSPTAIRADSLRSIGLLLLLIDSTSTTDDARQLEARQKSSLSLKLLILLLRVYFLLYFIDAMIADV